MAVNITYMGTKRELARTVAAVIAKAKEGPLLDAFSGMCSVGEEIAQTRQVWTNDAQVFSAEVATALFASHDEPPNPIRAADLLFADFDRQQKALESRYLASVLTERSALEASSYPKFICLEQKLSKGLATTAASFQNCRSSLFCKTYSGNYFGIEQAIEIDSIVLAIKAALTKKTVSVDIARWLMIALGRALLKTSNSTGHFAQFLKPKEPTYQRHIRQRKRRLWDEWLFSVGEMSAVGTQAWRKRNKCFNEDSLVLLPRLTRSKRKPAVIYADPPYTDDQYSRFYHLLETLILYDFPTVTGCGLYREARFATPFSVKSRVVSSFRSLIDGAARLGADLVLSYPTNGLLYETNVAPIKLLQERYSKVTLCHSGLHSHSTFGASKGPAKAHVTEAIYLAQT